MSPINEARDGRRLPPRAGWSDAVLLVGVLATIYMISQFFRNSIGVIGPDLAREFDLDARALSLLASIFFLSFALVQIPLGMAIDRFGPRTVILSTAAVVIAGSIYFALARSYADLVAARLIIGLGCSSFLMAPLAIYATRFRPERFSSIVGVHVAGGNIGSLAATAPLAIAAATIGWRGAFGGVAVLACLATALVFFLVREGAEAKAQRAERRESAADLLRGVAQAGRTPGFARIFLLQLASYPAFAAILGLWSGPWLADVYGMGVEERGQVLLVVVLAQIAGLFAWGSADRLFSSYKVPVIIGSVCCITVLALPTAAPLPRAAVLYWAAAFGFVFGFSPLLTAHGKSLFPGRLIGRGLSLMNIASIGGVFVQQILTGALIGLFPYGVVDGARVYPAEAYRLVFAFLAVQLAVVMLVYLRAPDGRTRDA
ncbi:MAG: MFS transporter [Beijerinckiaceae bacterium]